MSNKTKLGRATTIENKDRKPTEAKTYVRIWIEDANGGNEMPIFPTEKEFEKIKKRTEKNKEDWGKRGWLQDALD